MKRRRIAGKAAGSAPNPAGSPGEEEDGYAACRARLAASEAAFAEQGGRLAAAESALAASEAASSELRAANEALAREHAALKQEHEAALASLASSEAEKRARLAASGAGSSSVLRRSSPVDVELCPFLARRRDFGAELPAGVLLALMDRVPSSQCASFEISSGASRLLLIYVCLMFI